LRSLHELNLRVAESSVKKRGKRGTSTWRGVKRRGGGEGDDRREFVTRRTPGEIGAPDKREGGKVGEKRGKSPERGATRER